ncbi:MAG TPA: hypothetical protein VHX65_00150 [Pirellulales bacterium]|jgi:hypothetical protein|nr:hypothetical protein [Pirellulales bacterium]
MPNDILPSLELPATGPIFGPLVAAAPLNELGPGRAVAAAAKKLQSLSLDEAFAPHRIVDAEMAEACLAGLWLMYDHLDESHTISQSIETPTGSYWHAILHRREGDFSNSKYWFHRVAAHPVFGPLAEAARQIASQPSFTDGEPGRNAVGLFGNSAGGGWNPFRFVDLCEAQLRSRSPIEQPCRLIQQQECRLLFEFCYRRAIELS